jgi:hypothetical protein
MLPDTDMGVSVGLPPSIFRVESGPSAGTIRIYGEVITETEEQDSAHNSFLPVSVSHYLPSIYFNAPKNGGKIFLRNVN